MMSRRQVADLWGRAAIGATATQGDWALFYQELLAALGAMVRGRRPAMKGILGQLHSLLTAHRVRLAHSARSLASFASYTDLLLSHTEIVRWGPERHSDLGKAETS